MPSELRDRPSIAELARIRLMSTTYPEKAAPSKKEKTTGPMDKWVEPALASKASYEDHNGQPFGVVEHMQPLGEAPSSKVKARVKSEPRKSLLGKSAGAAAVQNTAESTPQPQTAPSTTTKKQDVLPEMEPTPAFDQSEPVVVQNDDTDDDDYAPDGKEKKKIKKPRGRPPRATAAAKTDSKSATATPQPEKTLPPVPAPVASQRETSTNTTPATTAPVSALPKKPSSGWYDGKNRSWLLTPEFCDDQKIQDIVEESKGKALEMGNQDTADHVHALWEDSIKKPRLRVMLVQVLTNIAGPKEIEEFHVHIKAAKRRVAQRKAAGTHIPATITGPPLPASHLKILEQNKGTTYSATGEVLSRPPPLPKASAKAANKSDDKPKKNKSQRKTNERAKEMDENPWPEDHATEDDEIIDPAHPAYDEDDNNNNKRPRLGRWHAREHSGRLSPPDGIKEPSRKPASKTASVNAVKSVPASVKPAPTPTSTTNTRATVTQTVEAMDSASPAPAAPGTGRVTRGATLAVPPQPTLKRSSEEAELDQGNDHDAIYQAKKQKLAEKVVHKYEVTESNERTLIVSPSRKTRAPVRVNGVADEHARQTRQTRQSLLDDDSDNESELSSAVSHHNTPPPFTLPATTGKRAKTKQSPQKRPPPAVSATPGVGGATGSDSPMDIDYSEEASENNDFCSACRSSGFLLCCDGCDRSFHFQCLDPPLDPNDERLNEPWFCFDCAANKRLFSDEQPDKIIHGIFAPLLSDLQKRNPTIFALPQHIQTYYEGVAADDHGNFINAPRAGGRRRAGFGDPVDLYKMRDAKGNLLFCYHCAQTSQGDRQVAQCDECAQVWHLDCLEPPLAIHPCITGDGRKVADWICPLHIEHELKQIDARRLFNDQQGRRLKIRRPRGAKARETFLSRGARNNGNIEILEVESSDDSDGEEFYTEEDPRRDGIILKMPDKGIKLDFIEKIKQDRVQQYRDSVFNSQVYGKAQGSRVQLVDTPSLTEQYRAEHSLHQRQAALNLAQFAHAVTNADLGLGSDNIETLLMGLVAEAPASALGEDRDDPKGVRAKGTADEKQDLEALQQLIARRLEALQSS